MKLFKNLLIIVALLTAPSLFSAGSSNSIGRSLLSDFSRGRAGDVGNLLKLYHLNDNEIREVLAYLSQFYEKPKTREVEAQELHIDINNIDPLVATLVIGLQHELDQRRATQDQLKKSEEQRLQQLKKNEQQRQYYYRENSF